MKTIAVALALAATLVGGQAVAQNIDTRAAVNGEFSPFGVPVTTTYGQTITIPAGVTELTSFGFEMKSVPSTVVFRGAVYRWDDVNDRAMGPALYESGIRSTTGPVRQLITFNPVSDGVTVNVNPGDKYVIFATTSYDLGVSSGSGAWTSVLFSGAYAGGHTVFIDSGADLTAWTGRPWQIRATTDMGFVASFGPAPVPAAIPTLSEWAMILLGVLLAGGAALTIQRRRQAA